MAVAAVGMLVVRAAVKEWKIKVERKVVTWKH